MNPIKKNPLGRGIESLIPKAQPSELPYSDTGKLREIDITDIDPNELQPRKDFDPVFLEALTQSIREKGVLQPLVVMKNASRYMLIAGERRFRAAGLAGLKSVPVVVVDEADDAERLELALIENTQRDDLKPLELAHAYKELMELCAYRQEDIARIAGKSRSAVANTLRLLELIPPVKQALEMKLITEGHARVFLTLDDKASKELLEVVLTRSLSVRQTEAMAKELLKGGEPRKIPHHDADKDAILLEMEDFFGSKVKFKNASKGGGGVIEIRYASAEELDKIINKVRSV